MKKSVVIAVLGLAVGAVSSFGQGSITFNSYLANNSNGIQTTIQGGGLCTGAAGYFADMAYSLTPINEAAGTGALNPGWTLSGAGSPSFFNVLTPFGNGVTQGYFLGLNNFELNPYAVGSTVYFEVLAYMGSSYASSLSRGHSASFSTTLATGVNPPIDMGLPGLYSAFSVSPIPEPTTLALAGLGGLSLLLLRRKQA